MTLRAQASETIDASSSEILKFVLDLEKYSEIDKKFLRVSKVEGPDQDGIGYVKLWGRMGAMPPAPDRQDFVLDRWNSLVFTAASGQPARMVFDFVGRFDCETADNGQTKVTHSYDFDFKGPFKFLERVFDNWLQAQIADEVTQLKRVFASS